MSTYRMKNIVLDKNGQLANCVIKFFLLIIIFFWLLCVILFTKMIIPTLSLTAKNFSLGNRSMLIMHYNLLSLITNFFEWNFAIPDQSNNRKLITYMGHQKFFKNTSIITLSRPQIWIFNNNLLWVFLSVNRFRDSTTIFYETIDRLWFIKILQFCRKNACEFLGFARRFQCQVTTENL